MVWKMEKIRIESSMLFFKHIIRGSLMDRRQTKPHRYKKKFKEWIKKKKKSESRVSSCLCSENCKEAYIAGVRWLSWSIFCWYSGIPRWFTKNTGVERLTILEAGKFSSMHQYYAQFLRRARAKQMGNKHMQRQVKGRTTLYNTLLSQ